LRACIILLTFLFSFQNLMAQMDRSSKSDSVYKKIDEFSQQKKFFKFIHKLMFQNSNNPSVNKKLLTDNQLQLDYDQYNCKIIRNISIETLDPFGFSSENEKEIPQNNIERFGNALHIKSKNWTIRNFLLFKQHQELDPLIIKESERLIRGQRFVRSVVIKPIAIANCTDSVDVSVRVLDTWSSTITGAFSKITSNLDFSERNFFGLGHEFDFNYLKNFNNSTINNYGYDTKYTIPNFKNTFINTTISSKNNLNNNTYKTFKIDRPFYSTLTKWAGGIYYDYRAYSQIMTDTNAVAAPQNFKIKTYSLWGGHAFNIFGNQTELGKTSHLVFATGFTNTAFLDKPSIAYDPILFSNSSKSALATIGISSQKYFKDKYLFRFGTIEDIPYGNVFSLTGGIENKNKINRSYFGGRFSYGDYFNFGYLQANIEAGSFFNNGKSEQSIYKFEVNYFTHLFPVGTWKFRQFIKPVLILGSNRLNSTQDRLNLIDVNGIPGFNSAPLIGTKKFLTTFQTQSYNQKNWYGFNFSPFLNFTLGFLDKGDQIFFSNKMYSQIGVGVLINNNYLVFSSFQFSFSYYPSLPIDGSNIIKTNTFQNSNIEFHDFQIGQPYIVPYQ